MTTPENIKKTELNTDHVPRSKLNDQENKKQLHPILEIIQFALIALIIVIPIRMFVAQPFIVNGESMDNTFHSGEYLIVDQISYRFNNPASGDVIIFRYPNNLSMFFIKRIIAVPGDTISINGNVVTITNDSYPAGKILYEEYITDTTFDTFITKELGEYEFFVMGDNRDRSSDSRTWGVLHREHIIGKAFLRLFPFDRIGIMPGMQTLSASSTNITN